MSLIKNIPLKKVIPEDVPLKILEIIPEESARHYKMIPISKKDHLVEVGLVYPEDPKSQEVLKFLAHQKKFDYKVFLITLDNFNELLKQYGSLKGEVKKALKELGEETKQEKIKKTSGAKPGVKKIVEKAPITKIVRVILKHAVAGKASDIHIEPTTEQLRIRFRLDGVLHSSIFLPLNTHPAIITRIKILANLKIDETRIPQDGRFSAKIENKDIDFRVSTFPTLTGEKLEIRVLDPTGYLKSFEELGLSGKNYEMIKEMVERPYGLILITGPTGCGKTTTLYTILNFLNKEGVNIVTLENPIEYSIEGANQSQIRPEIGYTFARGLRHIIRQDPDIIMVGEIRDKESAGLVIHAALTGHIVLSTLHTTDVLGVIPRLLDLKVKPFLIPSALNLSIAQRLVRKLCPYCKKKVFPNPKIKKIISRDLETLPLSVEKKKKIQKQFQIYEPVGCKKCKNEGYVGRVGIFEILKQTEQLSDIILEKPTKSEIKKEARRQGMVNMRQDGILKVLEGITSIEEVLRATEEK